MIVAQILGRPHVRTFSQYGTIVKLNISKMLRFVAILLFLASVLAFHQQTTRLRLPRLFQAIQVCSENELTNNNRIVVDTAQGAVVVTKIMDKYFAVNAKCPHLGTEYLYLISH